MERVDFDQDVYAISMKQSGDFKTKYDLYLKISPFFDSGSAEEVKVLTRLSKEEARVGIYLIKNRFLTGECKEFDFYGLKSELKLLDDKDTLEKLLENQQVAQEQAMQEQMMQEAQQEQGPPTQNQIDDQLEEYLRNMGQLPEDVLPSNPEPQGPTGPQAYPNQDNLDAKPTEEVVEETTVDDGVESVLDNEYIIESGYADEPEDTKFIDFPEANC